jgi:hypothetical protein
LQEAHLGAVEENATEHKNGEMEEEWDLEKKVPVQSRKKELVVGQASIPPPATEPTTTKEKNEKEEEVVSPERVSTSHVWLFPGANREARWIQMVRQAFDEEESLERGTSDSTDSGDQNEEGAIGNGERQTEGVVEGHLEIAADLAPGVVMGAGSDGEDDDDDDDKSEDGTEEKLRVQ